MAIMGSTRNKSDIGKKISTYRKNDFVKTATEGLTNLPVVDDFLTGLEEFFANIGNSSSQEKGGTVNDSKKTSVNTQVSVDTASGRHDSYFEKYSNALSGVPVMDMGNGEWAQYADQVDIDGYKYENVKYVHHADGTATFEAETRYEKAYAGNGYISNGHEIKIEYDVNNRITKKEYRSNNNHYSVDYSYSNGSDGKDVTSATEYLNDGDNRRFIGSESYTEENGKKNIISESKAMKFGYDQGDTIVTINSDGTATIQNPDGSKIDGHYVDDGSIHRTVEYSVGNCTTGISYSCNCKRYEVYKNDDGSIYQRNEFDTVGRPTKTITYQSDGSTSSTAYNNDGSVNYTSTSSPDDSVKEVREYPDGRVVTYNSDGTIDIVTSEGKEINGVTQQQMMEGTVPY